MQPLQIFLIPKGVALHFLEEVPAACVREPWI